MGGRFCSLDQTHSECETTLVESMSFRPRNRVKTKKKGLHRKLKSFCPQNQVKTKKKGLHRNLGLKSPGICGIYLCFQAPFRLFNQRSNLDGGTLILDRGTLNLDGGGANSRWEDASPPTIQVLVITDFLLCTVFDKNNLIKA